MERRSVEQAVQQVESTYDQAWGEGDLDALVACLTESVLVVTPRGDVARGHAEVRALLGAFLTDEAPGSQHESSLVRIEPVTQDVAVVDGHARVTSRPAQQRTTAVLVEHAFTDVLVERDGHWRIAHTRAYSLPDRHRLPSRPTG